MASRFLSPFKDFFFPITTTYSKKMQTQNFQKLGFQGKKKSQVFYMTIRK